MKAGIKAWFAEATGTLRTGIEEKQELRQTFEPKIPQLIESINRIIQAVETKKKGGQREVLIIVDDLDKPDVDVVLDLFHKKGPIVTQPQCKIVFTIPTALLYSGDYNLVRGNFSGFFPLPNIKIKEKGGLRNPANWNTMREVVLRRLDRALIDDGALEQAVEMSGGVVRELVHIIHGACTEALAAKKNSVAPQHVEQAVGAIRAEYSYSLTRKEDIEILRQVQQSKQLLQDDEKPLLRLLHMIFILGLSRSSRLVRRESHCAGPDLVRADLEIFDAFRGGTP